MVQTLALQELVLAEIGRLMLPLWWAPSKLALVLAVE